MSELPTGWVSATLGEMCFAPQYGWTASAKRAESRFRLLRTTDLHGGNIDWNTVPFASVVPDVTEKYRVNKGDILISRAGSVGFSAMIEDTPSNVLFASYLIRMRPVSDEIALFLKYFLMSPKYWDQVRGHSAGIAIPNINATKLSSISLSLPPLAEQRRIVAEIEKQFTRLDEGNKEITRIKANVSLLETSVAHAVITGKASLRSSSGTRIPTPITTLGSLERGKSRHRPRDDKRLYGGSYPFIQTAEVRRAKKGYISGFSNTYSEFGLSQSRLWPKGTLCITIAANIAETGILTFDACFPDSVVGFTSPDECVVRWVELFFRTEKARLSAYAPATAQKNINLDILRKLQVPMPPRNELRSALNFADEILSIASTQADIFKLQDRRANRLRQTVLRKAFSGQLVPQDSDDEPASVLLERIRTERTRNAETSRRRSLQSKLTLQS